MQDNELMKELNGNPNRGLALIIEKYAALVYSIIYAKLSGVGSAEDVKDCVSDVFMDFYLHKDNMDLSKGSMKGYLSSIAKHKGIDYYRKLIRVAARGTDINEEWESIEDINVNLEQSVIGREEKQELLQAIDTLGEPDKEIFIRKYYFGKKTKEIADTLKLRENTVDKKISRGLKKLRILLGGVDSEKEAEVYAK